MIQFYLWNLGSWHWYQGSDFLLGYFYCFCDPENVRFWWWSDRQ